MFSPPATKTTGSPFESFATAQALFHRLPSNCSSCFVYSNVFQSKVTIPCRSVLPPRMAVKVGVTWILNWELFLNQVFYFSFLFNSTGWREIFREGVSNSIFPLERANKISSILDGSVLYVVSLKYHLNNASSTDCFLHEKFWAEGPVSVRSWKLLGPRISEIKNYSKSLINNKTIIKRTGRQTYFR